MDKHKHRIFWLTLAVGICLAGCGGGGGGGTGGTGGTETSMDSGTVVSAKTLTWSNPTAYTDNTTLNPANDLDVIEVYVNRNGNFSAGDNAIAAVQAVDPGTGLLSTSFNLSNLSPYLPANVPLYVSVRAVANNGLKSDFSQAAAFSF